VRDLLVKQRTMLINALRGHAADQANGCGFYLTPARAEVNEVTATQIAPQSPSDNSTITISAAPVVSDGAASRADRSGRDILCRRLRSAAT
jgi:hypothetical protein